MVGELGRKVEIVEIVTYGDRSTAALAQIGGTGVFVSALRDALLAGDIDLAVHSYKDLPTAPADGLLIAAVPLREDPRDVLVARDGLTLGELPPGARIGTGSPRRAAQLRALGFGVEVVPIRGNVDTRLRKVADGELDAVVLARAGLARLDRLDAVTEVLDPLWLLPAPGQGALAVECRAADAALVGELGALDHPDSRAAVTAERALLTALEAGCTAPVGGLAEVALGEHGHRDLPPRLGDRGRRLRRRPAVRHRAGYPSRGDRTAPRRRAGRRRCQRTPGEHGMTRARKTTGRITFVGAGPGDPGLLTVRAAEALRTAAWSSPTPTSRPRSPISPARPPRSARPSATPPRSPAPWSARPGPGVGWSGWCPATRCPPTRWSARCSASPPPACRSTWCPVSPRRPASRRTRVCRSARRTPRSTPATTSTGRRRPQRRARSCSPRPRRTSARSSPRCWSRAGPGTRR